MRFLFKVFIEMNRRASRAFLRRFPRFAGNDDYRKPVVTALEDFVRKRKNSRVLEAGGIDRPLLTKSSLFSYAGLDIEFREQCTEVYDMFIVQSIEEPLSQTFDLICSMTLLEHVRDTEKALRSMYNALAPGGLMVHYVPSGLHPYSIILRLLGPRLSLALLQKMHPDIIGQSGYPAFFNRCTVGSMARLCKKQGFSDITFTCFYRANFYFEVFFPAFLLVAVWEEICRAMGLTAFCSGFIMKARKEDAKCMKRVL